MDGDLKVNSNSQNAQRSNFLTKHVIPALFKNIDDGILVSDMQGNIIFANEAAHRINDYEKFPTAIEKRASRFLFDGSGRRIQLEDLPIQRTLRQGEISNLEVTFVSSVGHKKSLVCSTSILKEDNGTPIGIILIMHDRTWSKESEKEKTRLEREKNELIKINEQLERFSSAAAHDLKSPLNTITQFTDLLKEKLESKVSPEELAIFERILKAGDRLRALIDDLLSFSKAGECIGEMRSIDLQEVVNEVIFLLEVDLKKSDAVVEIGYLPIIKGDYPGMLRVFQNLVANAIKYKGNASPVVRIFCETDNELWKVFVSDNGRGIRSEHLESVFELFNRQDVQRGEDGTGLGLPICKRIIEAHKGKLEIQSFYGQGTTLMISLPKDRSY